MSKKKRPAWKQAPNGLRKSPKGGERADDYNAMRFCWRVDWLDLDGAWGFRELDCETIWRQIVPRLHDLESQTWGELYGKKDGSTHPMPVGNIEAKAAARLRESGREDYDTLFQINVRGGIRLWGIRDRSVFYLLWYDPNHTVYVQKNGR